MWSDWIYHKLPDLGMFIRVRVDTGKIYQGIVVGVWHEYNHVKIWPDPEPKNTIFRAKAWQFWKGEDKDKKVIDKRIKEDA